MVAVRKKCIYIVRMHWLDVGMQHHGHFPFFLVFVVDSNVMRFIGNVSK